MTIGAAAMGQSALSKNVGVIHRVIANLQPGVWKDLPDYAYAGHDNLGQDLEKSIVEGIGMDSSHFSRFPLWIDSFRNAAPDGSDMNLPIIAAATGNQIYTMFTATDTITMFMTHGLAITLILVFLLKTDEDGSGTKKQETIQSAGI